MASLLFSATALTPVFADIVARRGGGGIGTFIRWIVTGVSTGQPVPLAFAGVGGLGIGWMIYSKITGGGDE